MTTELASPELTAQNHERLQNLLKKPIGFLAFDLHGFTIGKDPVQNSQLMGLVAGYVAQGGYFAGVTGYGERIIHDFINPFKEQLLERGIDPQTAPVSFATRNGARIEKLNGDIIANNPIPPEIFEEVVNHPLVRAINRSNTGLPLQRLEKEREENIRMGMKLHPDQANKLWGMRVDYSAADNECYQITGFWGPWIKGTDLSEPNNPKLQMIRKFCGGKLPDTPDEMADWLRINFNRIGLDLDFHTAASHPEIDIVMPGSHKGDACRLIAPTVAEYYGCTADEVPDITVAGGDSPFQNDRALLAYTPDNAVTNSSSYMKRYNGTGPIYLDFDNAQNEIDRTALFLKSFTALSR
jgi:hydroxymethylpyrimidine pyrophosphatase-like HAD family hydrolase